MNEKQLKPKWIQTKKQQLVTFGYQSCHLWLTLSNLLRQEMLKLSGTLNAVARPELLA